ncbi:cysteine protease [Coleophoma cylindrospora]|uniref:Cysteine protease n=1 Tax=Coleophoma cylindrospora TaxID=1849047 RepID=A0A3D8R1W3_9HELO|nr:cysteine protease [Coleophoma cylindrospora]
MTNVDFGRYKRIVQYFWDPEPTNDATSQLPVWCLGKQYPPRSSATSPRPIASSNTPPHDDGLVSQLAVEPSQSETPPESTASSVDSGLAYQGGTSEEDGGWPSEFLDDFEARVWFTYRSNFPAIAKSLDPKAPSSMSLSVRLRSQLVDQAGFTSDTGWGCMIRSGQSLLANAFITVRLGRDWRRGTSSSDERKIISLFADDAQAPFSIHKFVEHGASSCGKHPGEWFGPSATARCIQALTNNLASSDLKVYITGDGPDIYEDSFMKIAMPDGAEFRPTLILVGTRLGVDKITSVYWEALKASLQMPQSIGIAGGRPSSSHYFVGVQGTDLFYLDPHQTRNALPLHERVEEYTEEEINSCHTRRLRKISLKDMDPSMLIAFLIRDESDWKSWRKAVEQAPGKRVIHIADHDPAARNLALERDGAIDEVETFDDEDDEDMVLW